ncbi:MAG: chitobiase/beta-hexosaminidase C-terminal domain-containing protein, partial [Muribaculaceae bacterium]
MKKILLSIMMVVAGISAASAADVTFDFTNPETFGFTRAAEPSAGVSVPQGTVLKSGKATITVTTAAADKVKFWTGSVIANKAVDLRAYTTAVITIEAGGENITNIAIAGAKITPTLMKFSEGTYATGVWTGSTTSLSIEMLKTVNFDSFIVTSVSATGVANPKLTPGANVFYEPQSVSMSCATEGATIHYTLDGTVPTTSSTVYTAPIAINATTTIKAIASKGGVNSELVEAYYEIKEVVSVPNIAAFIAATKDAPAKITSPVYVTYQNGQNLFIKDETGSLLIYGDVKNTYNNGDKILGGIYGIVKDYNGVPEMTDPQAFVAGEAGQALLPTTKGVGSIGAGNVNEYIIIYGVTVAPAEKAKNYILSDGNDQIGAYAKFADVVFPTDAEKYDVTCIATVFGNGVQVYPISFKLN